MSDLENVIIEAIAEHVPFSFDDVRGAYLYFKSIDKLIAAINLSTARGLGYIVDIDFYLNERSLRTDIDYPTARMQQILENGLSGIFRKIQG